METTMACKKNTRKGDKPSADGPVAPGSPIYRMLERIAREIVKSWNDCETDEDRQKPGGGHEPDKSGQ
jgi:hypothetical protein